MESAVGEYDERWERRFKASIRHLELKERALTYKGGACQICGYCRCPAALHFHFADTRDRDFYISSASSWEQIQPALDRATLLCANCRYEVRAGWHPGHLVLEDERV
jgi:hypothetical protein